MFDIHELDVPEFDGILWAQEAINSAAVIIADNRDFITFLSDTRFPPLRLILLPAV